MSSSPDILTAINSCYIVSRVCQPQLKNYDVCVCAREWETEREREKERGGNVCDKRDNYNVVKSQKLKYLEWSSWMAGDKITKKDIFSTN